MAQAAAEELISPGLISSHSRIYFLPPFATAAAPSPEQLLGVGAAEGSAAGAGGGSAFQGLPAALRALRGAVGMLRNALGDAHGFALAAFLRGTSEPEARGQLGLCSARG